MINTQIIDGTGTKKKVQVDDQHALVVSLASCPPLIVQKNKIFRQFLTDNGTADGTSSMDVDGSSTNVTYYIPASSDADRYITAVSFIVSYGSSGGLYEWADAAALTNGFRLYYKRGGEEVDIHSAIKSNRQLIRLGVGLNLVPTGWELRYLTANNDYGYMVTIDFIKMMPPYGLKLDKGTSQIFALVVRDNITVATDSMNAIAYGFDREE
jgi:hypothetical protein